MSEEVPEREKERCFGGIKKRLKQWQANSSGVGGDERELENTPSGFWGVYDSDFCDFWSTFRAVCVGEKEGEQYNNLSDYLRLYYAGRNDLVGMEIGGPGRKLFKSMLNELNDELDSKLEFRSTVGVTLNDLRSDKETSEDQERNHYILPADVFLHGYTEKDGNKMPGLEDIKAWTEEHGKADLIIERMIAGISDFSPKLGAKDIDLHILFRSVLKWYELLNEEGTMFLELPFDASTKEKYVEPILNKLKEHSDFFDVAASTRYSETVLRLRRLPGSPDNLREILKGVDFGKV